MSNEERAEVMKYAAMYEAHKAYMVSYNKRPEVRAKRRAYNQERWALIKQAKEILANEKL